MLLYVGHDAVVNLTPHLVRRDRSQLLVGQFDLQLHRAPMPHVHDGALWAAIGPDALGADEQPSDLVDRPLGGAETDAL